MFHTLNSTSKHFILDTKSVYGECIKIDQNKNKIHLNKYLIIKSTKWLLTNNVKTPHFSFTTDPTFELFI